MLDVLNILLSTVEGIDDEIIVTGSMPAAEISGRATLKAAQVGELLHLGAKTLGHFVLLSEMKYGLDIDAEATRKAFVVSND